MRVLQSLLAGAAGAAVLTGIHETARRVIPHAPRVDVLGRRGVAGPLRALGFEPPTGGRLQAAALAGDLISNSAYYALLGLAGRRNRWRGAWLLGLSAGLGAVALPPVLGLGGKPTSRTPATAAMTVAWYTLGALSAAAAMRAMDRT